MQIQRSAKQHWEQICRRGRSLLATTTHVVQAQFHAVVRAFDAEEALRMANRRFKERFQLMEGIAAERRMEMRGLSLEQLDELWEEAKRRLAGPAP